MTRYFSILILTQFLCLFLSKANAQFQLPFGDIKVAELTNKPYLPDPGADAIILSDIGIASLNFSNGFYVEIERDIRIRIVNTNGFDYANIEIPVSAGDEILNYKASTFNLKDGEKTETRITKKSFFFERSSESERILKFSFPDVHEGSVIEYSYKKQLRNEALYTVIPWEFQSDIPVVQSSFTFSYPEPCRYKITISGTARDVRTSSKVTEMFMFGSRTSVINNKWLAENMPGFRDEPYTKSKKENLTKLTFELASIDFPESTYTEITPTYATLTNKLLERTDFGTALKFTKESIVENITKDKKDDLSKLKAIHAYISSKIQWNGTDDFTATMPMRAILRKEKGNSADINLLLIALLRNAGIKADPVILCTRSNGSMNKYSAMMQQFNYTLAAVSIGDKVYIVDATDPLRPFDLIPFDCLNGEGRLINEYNSEFIELKNSEKQERVSEVIVLMDAQGDISGTIKNQYSQYAAYNTRKRIKLESEEGYIDMMKAASANMTISDFKILNAGDPGSDLIESCGIKIVNGAQIAGDEIIFNPYFSLEGSKNIFSSAERRFPVDFGYQDINKYNLTLKIPEGYFVREKPADISFSLGKDEANFEFKCSVKGDVILISSSSKINKTIFSASEYLNLRDFFSKILIKQNELIVLNKITNIKN